MIAYTAIYGGYDLLAPHPDHREVEMWLCYTDDPDLQCDGWKVIHAPGRFEHPRLSAKWWKCHPPEADMSLWVDGSMRLNGPGLIDAMLDGLAEADWVLWRHPERSSILAEALVSERMQKYDGLPVRQQADHYRSSWGGSGSVPTEKIPLIRAHRGDIA